MYFFIKTVDPDNEFSKADIMMELPSNDLELSEILEQFKNFLCGCGFVLAAKDHIILQTDEEAE